MVTVISVVIGALVSVPRSQEKETGEIRNQNRNHPQKALLKSSRILRKIWRSEELYCHSHFSEGLPSNTKERNS